MAVDHAQRDTGEHEDGSEVGGDFRESDTVRGYFVRPVSDTRAKASQTVHKW